MHGGPTPSGAASPHFIHGKFSKALPAGLREHYDAQRRDPDVLVLMDELAVLDARLVQLFGRVDAGESASRWSAAKDTFAALKAAWSAKDVPGMVGALAALDAVIVGGAADYEVWRDVQSVMEQKRKIADTETKRLVRKHRVLTEDRAYELLRLVLHTVRAHILDRKVLGAIAGDLERVLGGTAPLGIASINGDRPPAGKTVSA